MVSFHAPIRGHLVLALALLGACNQLESEQAQQAAEATKKTVAHGVERARDELNKVDVEQIRDAWDSAVKNFDPPAAPTDATAEPTGDPLAGAEQAIACDEAAGRCTITAAYAARLRMHGARAARQVRAAPEQRPARGLRIRAVDPGSAAARLGLRKGDLVTRINGMAVGGTTQNAMLLYMQLRTAVHFTVELQRDDQTLERVIDIV